MKTAFIWRTGENLAVKDTGRAFSVPDSLESLDWKYVEENNPRDLGPVYKCIDCKLVGFEHETEHGNGHPTIVANVVASELVSSGRVCPKCAYVRFKTDWKAKEK